MELGVGTGVLFTFTILPCAKYALGLCRWYVLTHLRSSTNTVSCHTTYAAARSTRVFYLYILIYLFYSAIYHSRGSFRAPHTLYNTAIVFVLINMRQDGISEASQDRASAGRVSLDGFTPVRDVYGYPRPYACH